MRYFEKIPGERLYLSPINPDDIVIYTKWINDPEVVNWIGGACNVISLPCERAWLEANTNGPHQYNFAIVLRNGNRLLGNVSLMDVSAVNRSARLGIFIGETDDRSKGYGAEALKLMVDYGFRWLGLRNIDLEVDAENQRAIRCYEKVGFRQYGRRTDSIFYDGQWHDRVCMEVLSKDWL